MSGVILRCSSAEEDVLTSSELWLLLWIAAEEHQDGLYLGVFWIFALSALTSSTLAIGLGAIIGIPIVSGKLHWDLLSFVVKWVFSIGQLFTS